MKIKITTLVNYLIRAIPDIDLQRIHPGYSDRMLLCKNIALEQSLESLSGKCHRISCRVPMNKC